MTSYRSFTIDIIPRTGFAGRTWYFYRIRGNEMRVPVLTNLGEQTETLALDEAREFIDEHLASDTETEPTP